MTPTVTPDLIEIELRARALRAQVIGDSLQAFRGRITAFFDRDGTAIAPRTGRVHG